MSIWFTEELHPYYRKGIRIKKVLADEQTPYQHLQFVETEFFGKAMILDGIIQLTERDNMGYHEMIVHVPRLAVGKPKRVLIVGCGDGGSLQQVLRYDSVAEAVVCELDQRVVDLSREHFSAAFGDPWADPRTKLLVRDTVNVDIGDLRMTPEQVFDLLWCDVLAAANDQVFDPSRDPNITFSIHSCLIAGVQPSILIDGIAGRSWVVVVADRHRRAARQDLAGGAGRRFLALVVDDDHPHLPQRLADQAAHLLGILVERGVPVNE